MNHIFHYHITAFLALKAGFQSEEAQVVAVSAQLPDHALRPETIRIPGKSTAYLSPVTHHFGFWDREQERSIWMPFHFFPGASSDSARHDGRTSPFRVVPDSQPVKELLVEALKTRNLYRVGIALHTYADTWAHQEFSGQRDDFNILPGVLGIPPIGHAQAERLPDLVQARWLDNRLLDPWINNRARFMQAARLIYKYLATFQRRSFADIELVMTELDLLLGPEESSVPLDTLGSRVNEGVRQGISTLKNLAGRLSGESPGNEELIRDPRQAVSVGISDEELALNFSRCNQIQAMTGMNGGAWPCKPSLYREIMMMKVRVSMTRFPG